MKAKLVKTPIFNMPIFFDCDGSEWGFNQHGDLIDEMSNPCILLSDIADLKIFRDFIEAEIARREAADKGEQG